MTLPTVVVVAGAAALGLIWLVRRERRKAREKAQLLSTMGFQRLAQPDPELAGSLLALFGRGRGGPRAERLRLRGVFHRQSISGQVYLFDVRDPGSRRQHEVASGVVAVLRRGAGLPFLEVVSYAEGGGLMSKMMIDLIARGLGDERVVRFDDQPAFAGRHTVLAPGGGEEAARRCLAAEVRQKLMSMEFVVLRVGGDVLAALQVNPYSRANRGDELGTFRKQVEDALQLAELLEPGNSSSGEVFLS